MSSKGPPSWLEGFQKEWGGALTQPLQHATGVLLSPHPSPGLAAYNRQYWFRLFSVLQKTYELTATLVGYWHFNLLAQDYLSFEPPHHFDLASITTAFPDFLAKVLTPSRLASLEYGVEALCVVQAAQLERAMEQALLAPHHAPYGPDRFVADLAGHLQLGAGPHWQILSLDWPLWRIDPGALVPGWRNRSSERLRRAQHLLVMRWRGTLCRYELDPNQARLYESLRSSARFLFRRN